LNSDIASRGRTSISTQQNIYPHLKHTDPPFRGVEARRARPSKIPLFLRPDQVGAILNVPASLRDRLILRLLYFCALRLSEVLGLKLEDVDFENRIIRICHAITPSGLPKEYKERLVPVDSSTLGLIKEYAGPRTQGRLFQIGRRQVQKIVKKCAREVAIPGWERFTPHKLRHSFAVHWVQSGGDIERLRRILGHSNLTTTQIYLQFMFNDVRREYDRIMLATDLDKAKPVTLQDIYTKLERLEKLLKEQATDPPEIVEGG